jgi:hypothetical protein
MPSLRCTLLLSAILAAALLATGPVSAKDDRPGVGRNPAFVCFHTTITDKGHTRQSRIIRHSGNQHSDRGATRLVRSIRLQGDTGNEREAHILVKMYGTGFAFRFYELDETLPEICSTPPPERGSKKGDGGN